MTDTKERFRLRNMKVTRVDLVDRGANQDAHIVLAKADEEGSKRREGLADRLSAMMGAGGGGADAAPAGPGVTPVARPKGEKKQIVRLRPGDFELVESNGQLMEWAIPDDKLPEGVEEAIITMTQSGDAPMFQWMIDPLAGPPQEGQSKTADEAFMAMRAALSTTGAMDPAAMLGGFPGQKAQPQGANPGKQVAKRARILKRLSEVVTPDVEEEANPDETLGEVLDIIVKGLVEVDVFKETATGEDLGDILPEDSLEELASKLSAKSAE